MRCLQCNAEMALIGAVPADATLPGFEHHTFSCSACNEIERRLLFTGTKSLPSSSTWVRAVESQQTEGAQRGAGVSKEKLPPSVSGREAPQQRTDCESTPRCKLRRTRQWTSIELPNSGISEIAVNASLAFIQGAKPRDEPE